MDKGFSPQSHRGTEKTFRVLDLFCGAGGAAMGLHRAWPEAEIVGVDIAPQPRYPFTFVQGDAMTYPLEGFDFIWASPPCQAFTAMKSMPNAKEHENLLTPTRERLLSLGDCTFVIENVPGAPLNSGSVMLCGTMFGLGVSAAGAELRRHRWFEASFHFLAPGCRHSAPRVCGVYGGHGRDHRRVHPLTVGVYGNAGGRSRRDGTQMFSTEQRKEAMGIEWMNGEELSQAIPPAYSEYIAKQCSSLCLCDSVVEGVA
jgi:DNA (cytosine-5)-methyltransferase 1